MARAKGNFREGSDIDITLKRAAVTERIHSRVWLDIDDSNTPYLFDISVYHQLKSESLLEHINRVGKTFIKRRTGCFYIICFLNNTKPDTGEYISLYTSLKSRT